MTATENVLHVLKQHRKGLSYLELYTIFKESHPHQNTKALIGTAKSTLLANNLIYLERRQLSNSIRKKVYYHAILTPTEELILLYDEIKPNKTNYRESEMVSLWYLLLQQMKEKGIDYYSQLLLDKLTENGNKKNSRVVKR